MDVAKPHLLSLFFLQISSLWAQLLEPPSNVTLHCKNLNNTVEWDYGEIPRGLRFRVDVKSDSDIEGCFKQLWVDGPPLQADVSCFSHRGASYLLTVTAVNSVTESVSAPEGGIEFSYYEGSLFAKQKCYLDLPSVHLASQAQSQALLSLDHPCLLYPKMPECQNSAELPLLTYNVAVVSTGKRYIFECDEWACEEKLDKNDEQELCLRIDGELERFSLKPTLEHYCIPPPPPPLNSTAIVIIVALVAVAVSALIGCMVYRKFTQPSSPLPTSIKSPIATQNFSHPHLSSSEEYSHILGPSSPTPLLTATEEDCVSDSSLNNRSAEDDLRMRIGIPSEDAGACVDMEESSLKELRSPYMDGNDLEDNDVGAAPSDYERREAVV